MPRTIRRPTFRVLLLSLALAPLWHSAPVRTAAQNQPARKPSAPSGNAAAPKTSRVTVTSDAPLNDYSARSEGNRFYVDVPASSAPRVQGGRGVKNVRTLRRGDRTVLEFTLEPGTTARVSQRFNKLDVIIQQAVAAPAGSLSSMNNAASIVTAATPPPPAPRASNASPSPSPRPTPQTSSTTAAAATNQNRNSAATTDLLPALNLGQPTPQLTASPAATLTTAPDDSATGDDASAADNSDADTNAAPDSNDIAQTQTPPAPAPAGNVQEAPLSNNSLAARLARNWPLVSLAALLLAVAAWLVASRRRTDPPPHAAASPPARVDDEKIGAPASPAVAVASERAPVEPVPVKSVPGKPVIVEPTSVESAPVKRRAVESVTANRDSGQSNAVEPASRKTAEAAAATREPVVVEPAGKSTGGEATSDAATSAGAAETPAGAAAMSTGAPTAEGAAEATAMLESETAKPEGAGREGATGGLLPVAIEASLGSDDASERAEAVAQLVFVGGEEAWKRIGKAFADPAPQVRDAAARALFRFDKDYVASFTRVLRESTPEVRAHIAASIASSGLAAEAIGSLTGGTEKEIYESFSLLFLMAKSGEIKTLVRAIESHPNVEVRLAVIKLLSMSELPSVVAAFRRLQTDRALPVRARTAVTEALSQMSNQTAKDSSPAA